MGSIIAFQISSRLLHSVVKASKQLDRVRVSDHSLSRRFTSSSFFFTFEIHIGSDVIFFFFPFLSRETEREREREEK